MLLPRMYVISKFKKNASRKGILNWKIGVLYISLFFSVGRNTRCPMQCGSDYLEFCSVWMASLMEGQMAEGMTGSAKKSGICLESLEMIEWGQILKQCSTPIYPAVMCRVDEKREGRQGGQREGCHTWV